MAAAPAQSDWTTDFTSIGNSAGEGMSSSMIAIGDVNGDSHDDFIVGSPSDSNTMFLSGSVTVMSGVDGSVLATRSGESIGEGIGGYLTYLGEHDGDGLIKFASSSPFADSSNGMFSGLVHIYSYDTVANSIDLYTTIEGAAAGQMFGASLTGFEYDLLDTDLELAVGAIGHSSLDGAVYIFEIDTALQDATLISAATIEGGSGQKELLGYSTSAAQGALLVGGPFTDDGAERSGAATIFENNGAVIPLSNPFSGTEKAYFGVSVASGQDVTGDGIDDFLVSAPYSGNGNLVYFSDVNAAGSILTGQQAGERFGLALAIVPDNDFDGVSDVLISAPEANTNRGRVDLHNLTASPQEIVSFSGNSSGDLFGTSITSAGTVARDVNDGLLSPLLIGAAGSNSGKGKVYSNSLVIKDMSLAVSGSFEWYTDVNIMLTDLAESGNGTLYWYMGTTATPSVSAEGYDLDISGNLQLIAIGPNPGTQALETYTIPDAMPDGQALVFQVVEDRGTFVHKSNIAGEFVSEPPPPFVLSNSGNTAGQDMVLSVEGATAGATIKFYGTLDPVLDPDTPLGAGVVADSNGEASTTISIPANFSGQTVRFMAEDSSNSSVTPVIEVTLN
ncbi:MAG: FG-GAP repeat protein [Planctomycetes bacterium]|nr:FG-GAP repeat protein [Planctomycetota bacterium]